MDVVITRCSNNYGPYQHPEKLIPLMITSAIDDEPLPVYGDGLNVRDWIHVEDHCRGLDAALRQGRTGEVYNFGGDAERTNLEVVRALLAALDNYPLPTASFRVTEIALKSSLLKPSGAVYSDIERYGRSAPD